jgi:hypothetical protein
MVQGMIIQSGVTNNGTAQLACHLPNSDKVAHKIRFSALDTSGHIMASAINGTSVALLGVS